MKHWIDSWPLLLAAVLGSAIAPRANSQEIESSPGAHAVSLESLVAEALDKNPELRFYEAEITAAKAGRRTAGLFGNPEVNGSVGQKSVRGGGVNAEGVA